MALEHVSGRQYGFMPSMSTENAVNELKRLVETTESESYAMVLLFDISRAFNNVWWPLVLKALKDRNCPNNVDKVMTLYFASRH